MTTCESKKASPEPIVMSLEAKFHRIRDAGWNNKLIQFPKGGILWGLHLSEQKIGDESKVIGSLLCYGPMKEHHTNWSICFDHAFTLSCKRVGSASPIKKATCFNRRNHVISTSEWGDKKTSMPDNWGTNDTATLSCHMYITQTHGFERSALKEAGRLNPVVHTGTTLTSSQIEGQVLTCFSELLVEEDIEYSQEGFVAVEKLAKFFGYPRVLDICRKYLIKMQTVNTFVISEEEREESHGINLQGFDYPGNLPSRQLRMGDLSEKDVISIFQQLCSIAFKRSKS